MQRSASILILRIHIRTFGDKEFSDFRVTVDSRMIQRSQSNRTLRIDIRTSSQVLFDGFGYHDCRHYFISHAVMSGIDYMTIARWVGHKDGGVLIGRVYGHLNDEHAKRQAKRLKLG